MIPEIKLMAACGLDEKKQRAWLELITDGINEGPKVLLRQPKIRSAIISQPELLKWYSKTRVELELLYLKKMIQTRQCTDIYGVVNEFNTILQANEGRILQVIVDF
ncbi:hypothetical protein DPMN_037764 [Dreissena polymorpha]|uniref:Uncharacterized protein n=1 Tax=Dreissena polymorpha TaxID=45954 RepID=A0A9D4ME59_DREPO|nr:hypothetical protein DPMN_037764 [Dreissena polymorpha]